MSPRSSGSLGALAALLLGFAPLVTPAAAQSRSSNATSDERCRDTSGGAEGHYCEMRELGFRPAGVVRVTVRSLGGVHVVPWDRDSVHVAARLEAWAPSDGQARSIVQRLRVVASSDEIRARLPGDTGDERWLVMYTVRVPRRSDLALSTTTGPLSVEGVSGRMELEALNGPLVLAGVSGDVRGRTHQGPLVVTLTGATWEGAGLNVETRGGPVTVDIPNGYSARLDVGTLSGPPMPIDCPSCAQEWSQLPHVVATIGAGGARVRAVTRGGPVMLRRYPSAGR